MTISLAPAVVLRCFALLPLLLLAALSLEKASCRRPMPLRRPAHVAQEAPVPMVSIPTPSRIPELFGMPDEAEARLTRLAELIWFANDAINLVSRATNSDAHEVRFKHVDDCLPLVAAAKFVVATRLRARGVKRTVRILDVGSGAGLPGLVLAICMPDCEVTMVDSKSKKCRFIRAVAKVLSLPNVKVVWGRVGESMREDLLPHRSYHIVAARAVASMRKLVQLCAPCIGPGAYMLAMKGPIQPAREEICDAQSEMQRCGMEIERIHQAEDRRSSFGKRTVIQLRKRKNLA